VKPETITLGRLDGEVRQMLARGGIDPRHATVVLHTPLEREHAKNRRRYAQCVPDELHFEFATAILSLAAEHRTGIVAHEVGHCIAWREQGNHGEDDADEASERVLGIPICYDLDWPGKGLQCLCQIETIRALNPRRNPSKRGWPTHGTPPKDPSRYVRHSDLQAAYRAQYFDKDGNKLASSRTKKADLSGALPMGTWKIDDQFRGMYGHEIEELVLVADPRVLEPGEFDWSDPTKALRSAGKLEDMERYAAWMAEGHSYPPVEVVETTRGTLRISDGHRRAAAADHNGMPVKAWISWLTDHPDPPADRDMKVGLTYELATGQEFPMPKVANPKRRRNAPKGPPFTPAEVEEIREDIGTCVSQVADRRKLSAKYDEAAASDDVVPVRMKLTRRGAQQADLFGNPSMPLKKFQEDGWPMLEDMHDTGEPVPWPIGTVVSHLDRSGYADDQVVIAHPTFVQYAGTREIGVRNDYGYKLVDESGFFRNGYSSYTSPVEEEYWDKGTRESVRKVKALKIKDTTRARPAHPTARSRGTYQWAAQDVDDDRFVETMDNPSKRKNLAELRFDGRVAQQRLNDLRSGEVKIKDSIEDRRTGAYMALLPKGAANDPEIFHIDPDGFVYVIGYRSNREAQDDWDDLRTRFPRLNPSRARVQNPCGCKHANASRPDIVYTQMPYGPDDARDYQSDPIEVSNEICRGVVDRCVGVIRLTGTRRPGRDTSVKVGKPKRPAYRAAFYQIDPDVPPRAPFTYAWGTTVVVIVGDSLLNFEDAQRAVDAWLEGRTFQISEGRLDLNPYMGDAVEQAKDRKHREARERWEKSGRKGPPPMRQRNPRERRVTSKIGAL
jgi:hypothetical protein